MVCADACHQDAVARFGTTPAQSNAAPHQPDLVRFCVCGATNAEAATVALFWNAVHCIMIPPTAATEMTDDMSGGSQSDQADEVEVNVTA